MGYYVETEQAKLKAEQIVKKYGALVISQPKLVDEAPRGKTIICVVENGAFDAAGVVYSQDELEAFSEPSDRRRKTWLLMDKAEVLKLFPGIERWLTY